MVDISKALNDFQKRWPNEIPVVMFPAAAADLQIFCGEVMVVYTNKIGSPLVASVSTAVNLLHGSIVCPNLVSAGVQVAPLDDDDDN